MLADFGQPRLVVIDDEELAQRSLREAPGKAHYCIDQGGSINAPQFGLVCLDPFALPEGPTRDRWTAEAAKVQSTFRTTQGRLSELRIEN